MKHLLLLLISLLLFISCATVKPILDCPTHVMYGSTKTFDELVIGVYDLFPNMTFETFLIDKELQAINIKTYVNVDGGTRTLYTKSGIGKKIQITHKVDYNIRIRGDKITFFNPKVRGIPVKDNTKTACDLIEHWKQIFLNYF